MNCVQYLNDWLDCSNISASGYIEKVWSPRTKIRLVMPTLEFSPACAWFLLSDPSIRGNYKILTGLLYDISWVRHGMWMLNAGEPNDYSWFFSQIIIKHPATPRNNLLIFLSCNVVCLGIVLKCISGFSRLWNFNYLISTGVHMHAPPGKVKALLSRAILSSFQPFQSQSQVAKLGALINLAIDLGEILAFLLSFRR